MSDLAGERVTVRAGGSVIVDGVDCLVPGGSTTALLGPNGAGKSTLLSALAAVHRPAAGRVTIDGADLASVPRRRRARLAALVEQDLHTEVELTTRQVVALGRIPHEGVFGEDAEATRAVDSAIRIAGIDLFAERAFTTLSGGERQRVALARALAQQTPVLLLDEPTNHLDIAAQLATLGTLTMLAAGGVAVVAALHDLSLAASWADRVVVLARGRVVAAGTTADVLTPDLIRDVYGVHAAVLRDPDSGRTVLSFSALPDTHPVEDVDRARGARESREEGNES